MKTLVEVLARPGLVADFVADAVFMLMAAAADRESPHELEEVTLRQADGTALTVKRFPAVWARRLVRAAEAGAFKRREVKEIVETILTTEEPA